MIRALLVARDFLLTVAVVAIAVPVILLPRRAAVAIGALYGLILYAAWPVARRSAVINLRRAHGPAMTLPMARRWARASAMNMGRSIAEGLHFFKRYSFTAWRWRPAGERRRLGETKDSTGGAPSFGQNPSDQEHQSKTDSRDWESSYVAEDPELEQRILADSRPKIFVTAHLGSWEVASMILALRAGRRGAAVIRRVDNPFLNAIVRQIRLRFDSQWIEKRGAIDQCLRRLRAGDHVMMLVDENGGRRGVFVPFFGRDASTQKTPALLALMTGAPIVVGAAVRRGNGPRVLFRLALIETDRWAGAGPAAIQEITVEFTRILERWIREDPLQWRWIHWRWRSRPDGSEETYQRRDLRQTFESDGDADPAAHQLLEHQRDGIPGENAR